MEREKNEKKDLIQAFNELKMINNLLTTNISLLEKEKNRHLEANAQVFIFIKNNIIKDKDQFKYEINSLTKDNDLLTKNNKTLSKEIEKLHQNIEKVRFNMIYT